MAEKSKLPEIILFPVNEACYSEKY